MSERERLVGVVSWSLCLGSDRRPQAAFLSSDEVCLLIIPPELYFSRDDLRSPGPIDDVAEGFSVASVSPFVGCELLNTEVTEDSPTNWPESVLFTLITSLFIEDIICLGLRLCCRFRLRFFFSGALMAAGGGFSIEMGILDFINYSVLDIF